MHTKTGSAAAELMVVIGIGLVIGLMFICGIGGCFNKHVLGNKQVFDFRQNFRYAYITEGTNIVKYQIKAWKDWKDSDAVQVITIDDKAIYTHLNRVLLTDR